MTSDVIIVVIALNRDRVGRHTGRRGHRDVALVPQVTPTSRKKATMSGDRLEVCGAGDAQAAPCRGAGRARAEAGAA
jgi:hypothetical protein